MHPPLALAPVLQTASPDQITAVLEIMFFVAAADGRVEADELRGFLRLAKATGAAPASVSAAITSWKARGKVDVTARVTELSTILASDELRRVAYDLATRTAASDGHLGAEEARVLELIGDALDVG